MKKLSVVMLSMLLFVGGAFAAAKSNSEAAGKFGIGYSKATLDTGARFAGNVNIDQVAGRFWFSDDLGIDVRFGFGTGDVNTRILVDANMIGNILIYKKLNVYWLAGINFGSYTLKDAGKRGDDIDCTVFGIHGGVGAEFFVLPCLSLLTEMGIRYISVNPDGGDNMGDFGIFADWLPQAGVRFYFN